MAASVLQAVFNDDGGVTGVTLTVTLTNVQAGSTIHVFVSDDVLGTPTVSDPTNGAYSAVAQQVTDGSANQRTGQCFHANVAAVAGALVITATWTTTQSSKALCAVEVGSVRTVTPQDGATSVVQAAPGTGANAGTVGPPNPNNKNSPAILVALSFDATGSNGAPAAGTGFTSNGTGWGFGAAVLARVESKRFTGFSTPATFTAAGTGTNALTNIMAIYDESDSGSLVGMLFNDSAAE